MKEEIPQTAKNSDKEFARTHSYMLNAVAPFTAIFDKQVTGSDHSHQEM